VGLRDLICKKEGKESKNVTKIQNKQTDEDKEMH
jgi:hypothetical protein